jgi:NADPH-dependent 2,4-dienoyl-CoA reductase/sulfur reductase-like enzyme
MVAAEAGMRVTVIDESAKLGGQYFRGRQASEANGSPRHFRKYQSGIGVILEAAIVDAPAPGFLSVHDRDHGLRAIGYDALVIATGACDRAIALPGWTLPGVLTAGGASTLAKVHGVAPGRRMLVAGSGAFLLSVAADLAAVGCSVEIVEATRARASARGLAAVAGTPGIARETLGHLARLALHGVRLRYASMVTAIHGGGRVEAATIQRVDAQWNPLPGSARTVAADGVCLGFGFVPQLELAEALGCALAYDEVAACFHLAVDDGMRTSLAGIYGAGEATGIGGMRVAVAEGRLAGLAAARDAGLLSGSEHGARAAPTLRRLRALRRVAGWMRRAYAPRPGLWRLPEPATVLCRCEGVSLAEAAAALEHNPPTPYAVKTATRAGMGLCQGRICSPYLIEWLRSEHGFRPPGGHRPWRVRPPLRPVPLGEWPAAEAGP